MTYTVMTEVGTTPESQKTGQWAFAARGISIDCGRDRMPVYAEMTIHVEGLQWEGQRPATLTVFPRPSTPVRLLVRKDGWPPAVSSYSTNGVDRAAAFVATLDRMSDQAVEWVNTFVRPLIPEAR